MLIDISPSVTSIGFWGVTGSKKVIDISRAKTSIDINWPILMSRSPVFRTVERHRGNPSGRSSALSPFSGLSNTISTQKSRLMKLMKLMVFSGRVRGRIFGPHTCQV